MDIKEKVTHGKIKITIELFNVSKNKTAWVTCENAAPSKKVPLLPDGFEHSLCVINIFSIFCVADKAMPIPLY